jgi:hypothetical protein
VSSETAGLAEAWASQQSDAEFASPRPSGSVGASVDAEQQRVRESVYVLRNYTLGSLARKESWVRAIKELVEIGKPAVPELVAELDRTERDNTVRALGFTLRAIGDARAVPALIRSLPRTATMGSDLGLSVYDRELHAFMVKHDKDDEEREYPRFSYGRAVNEITEALEKITGHSEGDGHRRGARSDDAEQIKAVRDKRLQAAKRWEDWWSGNWQELLTKEQLDSVAIGPRQGDPVEAAGIARYGPPIPTGKEFKLGPVIEMLVPPYHLDLWDNKAYLDLDTGRLLTKFEGGRPAGDSVVSRWYEQAGVDAHAVHWSNRDRNESGYRLKGLDTYVWQIDNSRWETIEAQIRSDKPLGLGPPSRKPDFFPRNQTGNWPGYDLSDIPATFLFNTREGGAGILQIVAADENSEGARIRYRLVEGPGHEPKTPAGDIAVGGQPSDAVLSFGPVTEMTVLRPDAEADNAVDLDTGEHHTLLLTTAYPLSKAVAETARESGTDLVSVLQGRKADRITLAGFEMISMPVSSAAWENMTVVELMDFLARDTVREEVALRVRASRRASRSVRPPSGKRAEPGMVETVVRKVGKTWDEIKAGYPDDLPKTFLFKTREGGKGILQITNFVDGDGGLKIRYKMIRAKAG